VHEPFSHYLKSSGYGSPDRVAAAAAVWGTNRFEVPLPPFASLLAEHMLAPFFVFQLFCVLLWCLDEYWWACCRGGVACHRLVLLLSGARGRARLRLWCLLQALGC
jgi:cation-transporting ATPase 13A1